MKVGLVGTTQPTPKAEMTQSGTLTFMRNGSMAQVQMWIKVGSRCINII